MSMYTVTVFFNKLPSYVHIWHFIGMFYFTLGNLQPKFRSKLSAIQLIAIVKTTILAMYGMDAVLQPLVDDLKKLVGVIIYLHNYACKPTEGSIA